MKLLCACLLLTSVAFSADADDASAPINSSLDSAVESYESLATVIIEMRRTEDAVVKTILIHHYNAAQEHLKAAQGGGEVLKHLEAAATEVTYVANEGDKRVQAIRQRLSMAGHTHLSDVDTKEDYLFVNSREKKALLDAAKEIVQLGGSAKSDQVAAAAKKLEGLFRAAVAPEGK